MREQKILQEQTIAPRRDQRSFFLAWVLFAILALFPVTFWLKGSFPIFTLVWLIVPLIVLLRSKNPRKVGLRLISRDELLKTTGLNLGALLLVMAAFEPWSHTYRLLIAQATAAPSPDTTFAWLVRIDGPAGWMGMAVYSGLVTLFAEELFFRGWLLQWLQERLHPWLAIGLQAAIFTLPQAIAALFLPPIQGGLYVVIYSWMAIGVIGGWAALRTQSIWPSLISATVCNLILTALVR